MKKNLNLKSFVAIFAASTLFACTQDSIDNLSVQTEEETEAMNELPKRRTYEEALAVAQDAIGLLGENCTTRSGKPRSINTADVQYIVNTSSTRSTEEPDTLMYVFNYEDNAGFAVVSANRATEELIAVTEQGNYVAGEETGNGGFDLYMDMAEEYVTMAAEPLPWVDGDDDGMEEFTQYRIFKERDTVYHEAIVDVAWGQDPEPYNNYCPTVTNPQNGWTKRADVGCLPLAIAQILSYIEKPSTVKIDFDSYNYNQSLDWNAIKRHKSYSTCNSNCTNTGHNQLALLCRQLGKELNADYKYNETGAYDNRVTTTLKKWGLSVGAKSSANTASISSSLASNSPVLMLAEADIVQNGVTYDANHAWVVDGCAAITEIHRECIKPDSQLFWTELNRYYYYYSYIHCNWGWHGDCNGYFSTSAINPKEVLELDEGSRLNGYYDFDYYNFYIYPNIR